MTVPIIFVLLNFTLFDSNDTTGYKYLLQYEPDVISYENLRLKGYGRHDLCKLLIDNGALVNSVNDIGHTPLHYATRKGY